MSKIGFIGLGVMGGPMAGNLIAAGHELFLRSRGTVPEALVKAGGVVCASGKEVAERSQSDHHHGAGHAGRRRGPVLRRTASAKA